MSKKELALQIYINLYLNPASDSYNGVCSVHNLEGKAHYKIDEQKFEECINTASEMLNTYDRLVGYGSHKVSE